MANLKFIVVEEDQFEAPETFTDYKSAAAYAEQLAKERLEDTIEIYQLTATFVAKQEIKVVETEAA